MQLYIHYYIIHYKITFWKCKLWLAKSYVSNNCMENMERFTPLYAIGRNGSCERITINQYRNIQERHTGFANFPCEFENMMETINIINESL